MSNSNFKPGGSKNILFLMSGSIACYKACHVLSRLVQAGHHVQVVASESALEFVGSATLEGLTGKKVLSDLWEKGRAMDHIHLIREADLILAAPATAHLINRMAYGLGDDLLTTLFLAHDFKKPFLLAPAMNTAMYLHPVTQESLKKLRAMGIEILEAASGVLACGETGYGKLLEPDLILKEIEKFLAITPRDQAVATPIAPSKPPKILITAGGTREAIDDVRVLTNTSTGRSGAQLADLLSGLGMDVTLLRAQEAVRPELPEVKQKTFVSFGDLEKSLEDNLKEQNFTHVIQMAAVSDYTLSQILVDGKSPKDANKIPSGGDLTLQLKPTAKLIGQLKKWSPGSKVVGFKLTSHASPAERDQAALKVLDFADVVVQNDLSEIDPVKNLHRYQIYSGDQKSPVAMAGFTEMSSWLASWIKEMNP